MFPDDEICSAKQAKLAARRIFEKYQKPKTNDIDNTGVSELMKDTYQALNMGTVFRNLRLQARH